MLALLTIITLIIFSFVSKKGLFYKAKLFLLFTFIVSLVIEFNRQKTFSEKESFETYFQSEPNLNMPKDIDEQKALMDKYDKSNGKMKLVSAKTQKELSKKQIEEQKGIVNAFAEIEKSKQNDKYNFPLLFQQSIQYKAMEIKESIDWFGAPDLTFLSIKNILTEFINYFRGQEGEQDNIASYAELMGSSISEGYVYTKARMFYPKYKLNAGISLMDSLRKNDNSTLAKTLSENEEIKWIKQSNQEQQLQLSLKSIFTFILLALLTCFVIYLPIMVVTILRQGFTKKVESFEQ